MNVHGNEGVYADLEYKIGYQQYECQDEGDQGGVADIVILPTGLFSHVGDSGRPPVPVCTLDNTSTTNHHYQLTYPPNTTHKYGMVDISMMIAP